MEKKELMPPLSGFGSRAKRPPPLSSHLPSPMMIRVLQPHIITATTIINISRWNMRNLLLHLSWKEYIVDQAGLIRMSYLLCAILLVFSRIVRQTVRTSRGNPTCFEHSHCCATRRHYSHHSAAFAPLIWKNHMRWQCQGVGLDLWRG